MMMSSNITGIVYAFTPLLIALVWHATNRFIEGVEFHDEMSSLEIIIIMNMYLLYMKALSVILLISCVIIYLIACITEYIYNQFCILYKRSSIQWYNDIKNRYGTRKTHLLLLKSIIISIGIDYLQGNGYFDNIGPFKYVMVFVMYYHYIESFILLCLSALCIPYVW